MVIKCRQQDSDLVNVSEIMRLAKRRLSIDYPVSILQNLLGECINMYKEKTGRDIKVVLDERDYLSLEM